MDDELNCMECGACCTGGAVTDKHVHVTSEDLAQWPSDKLHFLSSDQEAVGRHYNGRGTVTCMAFSGQPGGSCRCTIYENRPSGCRRYEIGGECCLRAREAAGVT